MLIELNINNFALIQELSVEFGSGFNILSGETGAGKSILIDTIDYVLGGKFSKDQIRYGEDKTIVEAVFSIENDEIYEVLEELGIEKDEMLIIRRETTLHGKSLIKVNNRSIVLSQLKKIREKLLDIHGQHQNQNLLNKGTHILYVDEFYYDKIKDLLKEYGVLRDNYLENIEKINSLTGNKDGEKLADYIKFQIEDIEKANLKVNEEEELKDEFNMLSNAEKISNSLVKSYGYLNSSNEGISVLEGLSKVISELSLVENHSEIIREKKSQIEEAFYSLEEVTREIRDVGSEIQYDEDRLAQINERIYTISLYKKKYGNSIQEILDNLKNLKEKYNELVNAEEIVNKLKEELVIIEDKMKAIGKKLHDLRVEAAEILEINIKRELSYVGLEKAIIKIEVNLTDEMNSRGYDEVQFLVSANPGEPLKPLEKVLSGGELSRIMLALKCVFADKDEISTLIFDEIDTGISGAVGQRVGEKMYQVSLGHQVLCITHLPQIAILSDHHYFVSKEVVNDKTFTRIRMLSIEDKINQVASMMGGNGVTEATIQNVKEMLKFAESKKDEIKNL